MKEQEAISVEEFYDFIGYQPVPRPLPPPQPPKDEQQKKHIRNDGKQTR